MMLNRYKYIQKKNLLLEKDVPIDNDSQGYSLPQDEEEEEEDNEEEQEGETGEEEDETTENPTEEPGDEEEAKDPEEDEGTASSYSLDDELENDENEEDTSGDTEGEGEEGDTGEETEGEGDTGEETEDELKRIEDELYANMEPYKRDIQIHTLKKNYSDIYSSINDSLFRIKEIEKTSKTVKILSFCEDKLTKLKEYIIYYLDKIYDNTTYVENSKQYHIFITIMNDIANVLEKIALEDKE